MAKEKSRRRAENIRALTLQAAALTRSEPPFFCLFENATTLFPYYDTAAFRRMPPWFNLSIDNIRQMVAG